MQMPMWQRPDVSPGQQPKGTWGSNSHMSKIGRDPIPVRPSDETRAPAVSLLTRSGETPSQKHSAGLHLDRNSYSTGYFKPLDLGIICYAAIDP